MALVDWGLCRDVLADLWDWWSEGVMLRPQPRRGKRGVEWDDAYVRELIEHAYAYDIPRNVALPGPKRSVSADAQLGDALFRIAAFIHFSIAKKTGWLDRGIEGSRDSRPFDPWSEGEVAHQTGRRCQTVFVRGSQRWVLFAPAGGHPGYFANYVARINAAGWRPTGPFPLGCDLRGSDLSGVTVTIPIRRQKPTHRVLWDYANLAAACIAGSCLYKQQLVRLHGPRLLAWCAFLELSQWEGAVLRGADLRGANLRGADLRDADLRDADLRDAKLDGADLSNAIGP